MGSKRDYVTTQRLIEKTVREWNWRGNPCTVRFIQQEVKLSRQTVAQRLKDSPMLNCERKRVKNNKGIEQWQNCWYHWSTSEGRGKNRLYPAITEYCIESIKKFDEEDFEGGPFRRYWAFVQMVGIAEHILKMEAPEITFRGADIEYSDYIMRDFKFKILGRLAELANPVPLSPRGTS
jgi:hypothetical protein